jgi:hypothetical protein
MQDTSSCFSVHLVHYHLQSQQQQQQQETTATVGVKIAKSYI